MKRNEFESVLDILSEFTRVELEVTLSGNRRQIEILEEEYREACLRFYRKTMRLKQSTQGMLDERTKILKDDIPFVRQEYLLLGAGSPAAKVVVASKLKALRDKQEVVEGRIDSKTRELRLNARSLAYFEQSTKKVGRGYELIEIALIMLDHMEALGIDPKSVKLEDRRRLEVYFDVTD